MIKNDLLKLSDVKVRAVGFKKQSITLLKKLFQGFEPWKS
jgi:hypothetical protein